MPSSLLQGGVVASVLVIAVSLSRRFGVPYRGFTEHWCSSSSKAFYGCHGFCRSTSCCLLFCHSPFRHSLPYSVFAALTATVWERGRQWLLFWRFLPPSERRVAAAFMVGAGHGGIEALAIATFCRSFTGKPNSNGASVSAHWSPKRHLPLYALICARVAWRVVKLSMVMECNVPEEPEKVTGS